MVAAVLPQLNPCHVLRRQRMRAAKGTWPSPCSTPWMLSIRMSLQRTPPPKGAPTCVRLTYSHLAGCRHLG